MLQAWLIADDATSMPRERKVESPRRCREKKWVSVQRRKARRDFTFTYATLFIRFRSQVAWRDEEESRPAFATSALYI